MKELWLCRHAYAQGGAGVDDHRRDLTAAGQQAAEALGRHLARVGLGPQLVLTSSALRARRTAELAFGSLEPPPPIVVLRPLYLAAPAAIRGVIATAGGDVDRLAVVGHNPGLHLLARDLAVEGDAAGLGMLWAMFPPCTLARIKLPITSWREIARTRGRLVELLRPGAGSTER